MPDPLDPLSPEDAALLADLGRVASVADPVPDAVREAAAAAFSWRTIDEELAELAALTYDSLDDARPLAGVRGAATLRTLSFESGDIGLELDIEGTRVEGQVVPGQAATVEIQTTTGTVTAEADASGYFRAELPAAGPATIRIRLSHGIALRTDWIRL